jgi:hypothetical protein
MSDFFVCVRFVAYGFIIPMLAELTLKTREDIVKQK